MPARHVFANGSDCPVLVSYQMWFGQKLFKNAKITTKIMKIWLFCEIQSGNAQNWPFPVFWHFSTIFGQKLFKNAKKPEMADFGATRSGFHKNSQIFIILLLVLAFLSNFWPNHIWQLAKTGQSDPLAKTCLLRSHFWRYKKCKYLFLYYIRQYFTILFLYIILTRTI